MIVRYTHLFPIFKSKSLKDTFGILIFPFEIVSLSLSDRSDVLKINYLRTYPSIKRIHLKLVRKVKSLRVENLKNKI